MLKGPLHTAVQAVCAHLPCECKEALNIESKRPAKGENICIESKGKVQMGSGGWGGADRTK